MALCKTDSLVITMENLGASKGGQLYIHVGFWFHEEAKKKDLILRKGGHSLKNSMGNLGALEGVDLVSFLVNLWVLWKTSKSSNSK